MKLKYVNKNIKIIDASYGLEETYAKSDIWLNPSNILMLAQNIKQELSDYIENPYLKQEINNNYKLLKLDISELDVNSKIGKIDLKTGLEITLVKAM